MTKTPIYTYLGTNGTLVTGIHLEGVPCMVQYKLVADKNKVLTNGLAKETEVTIYASDLENWREVIAI